MQRPRLLLQGPLPRAVRPQQLALPQLREKSCDNPCAAQHDHQMIMSLHVSQLHVSQLNVSQMHVVMHAADMRHARTDARTATVTSRALSALVCVSSTWSPSVWCRA